MGGHPNHPGKSDLSLEQAAEVAAGVLPRELRDAQELPKQWLKLWQTPSQPTGGGTGRSGNRKGEPLLDGQARLWQTPSTCERGPEGKASKANRPGAGGIDLQTEARQWQTPRVSDQNKASRPRAFRQDAQLREEAEITFPSGLPAPLTSTPGGKSSKPTRRLNPRFVEWLMGWPLGLTAFACSATELSRYRRRMRSWLCWLVSAGG